MEESIPLLSLRDVRAWYPLRRSALVRKEYVKAVDGVSFDVHRGEIVGLVGESGSGKTTVGRAALRLAPVTEGTILFDGVDVSRLSSRQLVPYRQKMQMIFQDPFASLDPRKSAGAIVGEALAIHKIGNRHDRVGRIRLLFDKVGLPHDAEGRFPHQFSGGQRQRIGIARALAVGPRFLVADEPVSALDVSVQAQVINLLRSLRENLGLTLLFISHDLNVVRYLCDHVIIMYLGKIMEVARKSDFYRRPRHPYSQSLLSATPKHSPRRQRQAILLDGDIPSPIAPPSGCVFRTRCPVAVPICAVEVPPMREVGAGHTVACLRVHEL